MVVGGLLIVWIGLTPCAGADEKDAIQQAIDKGVKALKGMPLRGNDAEGIGTNALAGLTLLECGVPADDPVLRTLARKVQEGSGSLTYTYSLALAMMFLDRLGDPADAALIQSMAVRLLAGQNSQGGWAYHCPHQGEEEIRRLSNLLKRRPELRAAVGLPKAEPGERRAPPELPKEIQAQLAQIKLLGPNLNNRGVVGLGDNSNTQFAILGLWIAQRHGIPVARALGLTEKRFRAMQNGDGGWGYIQQAPSTASMTCAGLLALALGYASANEVVLRAGGDPDNVKPRKAKASMRDPGNDAAIRAGLQALSTAIGMPAAHIQGRPFAIRRGFRDRVYYFFWSLERVAVAYDLKTIGHKDWYAWGSEILVASQGEDGTWLGEHGESVDTCFALLFLRRANLAQDLTTSLKGKVKDPGEVALRSGGVGGADLNAKLPNLGMDFKGKPEGETLDGEAARLAAVFSQAPRDQQEKLLTQYQDAKGVAYTEALAAAIAKVEEPIRTKAREALAGRLARMTTTTLRERLKDASLEIRCATARACAAKDDPALIPDLIAALESTEPRMARASHTALVQLAGGKDFGPAANGSSADKTRAIANWKRWWQNRK
jgi:hypothetical protein